jgi:hypothetical protein
MIAATKTLTAGGATADFSTETLYGTNATTTQNTVSAMWAGDVNSNGTSLFEGASNDNSSVFQAVLGDVGNTGFFGSGPLKSYVVTNVYNTNDVNMNGNISYEGSNNDVSAIFSVVLSHPANTGFFGSGPLKSFSGATAKLP